MISIVTIGFITVVATIISFVSGFGLGTIMTSLLIFMLPPVQIIILIGIIHCAHSLWKLILYKEHINWQIGLLFGLPAMVASFGGALLLQHAQQHDLISRALGLFLIFYAIILWIRPSWHIVPSDKTLVIGGILSGFCAGFFGIRGAIRASTLSSYNLKKEIYIATTGFVSLLVDTIRLSTYWYTGILMTLNISLRWGLLIFIPLSFFGALIGRRIVDYIPQHMFRTVVAVFIFLAGIKLLVWPI